MATFRKYGLDWVVVGIATAVSGYIFKGTEYENMWLYVFAFGLVLVSILEVYSKIKDRNKQ